MRAGGMVVVLMGVIDLVWVGFLGVLDFVGGLLGGNGCFGCAGGLLGWLLQWIGVGLGILVSWG